MWLQSLSFALVDTGAHESGCPVGLISERQKGLRHPRASSEQVGPSTMLPNKEIHSGAARFLEKDLGRSWSLAAWALL